MYTLHSKSTPFSLYFSFFVSVSAFFHVFSFKKNKKFSSDYWGAKRGFAPYLNYWGRMPGLPPRGYAYEPKYVRMYDMDLICLIIVVLLHRIQVSCGPSYL